MSKKILLAMLLVVGLAGAGFAADTWHVFPQPTNGTGVSWSDPFNNLDSALLVADAGDTVLVARGKYVPTGTTFSVAAGVTIKGGYSGYWDSYGNVTLAGEFYAPDTYPTVLSGDTNGDDVEANLYANRDALDSMATRVENKGTIMTLAGSAIIDGCIFWHGGTNMNAGGSNGIACAGGTVTINDCQFFGCVGDRVVNPGSSAFTMSNCYFQGNAIAGGLVDGNGNWTISKCTFKGNSNSGEYSNGINYGGGGTLNVSNLLTLDSITGGASAFGSFYVEISGNNATVNASGCLFYSDQADACATFLYNDSDAGGGFSLTVNMTNCLWAKCMGHTGNGCILVGTEKNGNSGTFNLTNCTVADCKDGGMTGGVKAYSGANAQNQQVVLNIKNSILWGNAGAQVSWSTGTLYFTDTTYNPFKISYSCIDTTDPNNFPAINVMTGIPTGLVAANPQFKGSGDYHLASTSPCIDKGDPASSYVNEPKWLNGCRINMGAYGNTAEAELTTCSIALTADATGDCKVGNPDLLTLRNQWNKSCPGSFP